MASFGHRIVGGLFGLEAASGAMGNTVAPPFAEYFASYFLGARCAIYSLCQALKPQTAWLPSYLCSAVVDPFKMLGIQVRYYGAIPNLAEQSEDWVTEVQPTDMVLVIHYFGFPNSTLPAAELAFRGAVIVEDASQAFFIRKRYTESRCIIYSPRKFLGVPDGGVLASSHQDSIHPQTLEPPPSEWWRDALAVTEMRRDFDLVDGENRWFSLFRRVEETFPLGSYRSSELTRAMIEGCIDYEHMRRSRRANYLALIERLEEFALFPVLDEHTVPLGFPVCVDAKHRDLVLETLYKQRIYPPVHWPLGGLVPGEYERSHLLSQRILTLICDQRYTINDMARQVDVFLSAIH